MFNFEEDPEVASDLALRAATERDRTRSRGDAVYAWQQPQEARTWPCRIRSCRRPVGVTQDAVDMLAQMNVLAKSRGFEAIREDEVMFCDLCGKALLTERQIVSGRISAQITKHVRELKANTPPGPERERELVKKLELLGHPDVKGLTQALSERRNGGRGKRTRRDEM